MPTKQEVIDAVAAAAQAEAVQVADRIKELEDAIAAASMSDADREHLVGLVQGIFTPAAPAPAPAPAPEVPA